MATGRRTRATISLGTTALFSGGVIIFVVMAAAAAVQHSGIWRQHAPGDELVGTLQRRQHQGRRRSGGRRLQQRDEDMGRRVEPDIRQKKKIEAGEMIIFFPVVIASNTRNFSR
jgi:hypothetical protein